MADVTRSHAVDPDLPPELPRQRLRWDVVAVVFAGGCLGGLLRYAVTDAWSSDPLAVPWSTLAVNVAGAFVLGVVVAMDERWRRRWFRPLLGTGVCGALTTFGALAVVLARQLAHGRVAAAIAYLALTVLLSLPAVLAGARVGRRVAWGGAR